MAAETWDERYRRGEHAGDAPLPFIADWLERFEPGGRRRALDLACGSGRHSVALASHGWDVTAVDKSSAALQLLRAREARVVAIEADLETGGFPIESNSWDLICITLYMQRDLFPAIRVGLKCGGLVLAAFPIDDERPGVKPMNREFLLRSGELRTLFDGFELLHDIETGPTPPKRRMAELIGRKQVGQAILPAAAFQVATSARAGPPTERQ